MKKMLIAAVLVVGFICIFVMNAFSQDKKPAETPATKPEKVESPATKPDDNAEKEKKVCLANLPIGLGRTLKDVVSHGEYKLLLVYDPLILRDQKMQFDKTTLDVASVTYSFDEGKVKDTFVCITKKDKGANCDDIKKLYEFMKSQGEGEEVREGNKIKGLVQLPGAAKKLLYIVEINSKDGKETFGSMDITYPGPGKLHASKSYKNQEMVEQDGKEQTESPEESTAKTAVTTKPENEKDASEQVEKEKKLSLAGLPIGTGRTVKDVVLQGQVEMKEETNVCLEGQKLQFDKTSVNVCGTIYSFTKGKISNTIIHITKEGNTCENLQKLYEFLKKQGEVEERHDSEFTNMEGKVKIINASSRLHYFVESRRTNHTIISIDVIYPAYDKFALDEK